MRCITPIVLALAGLLLEGCLCVGPDYEKPCPPPLNDWQWKTPEPQDDLPKGNWWELFQDPVLNTLQAKAAENNPNLQAVVATMDNAYAQMQAAMAALLPNISFGGQAQRIKTSANQPTSFQLASVTTFEYIAGFNLSYEIDFWGQIRRTLESVTATFNASIGDYYNALLSLQAQVANNYFTLRIADANRKILEAALFLRTKNRELIQLRYDAGISDGLDLAQAQTVENQTQASILEASRTREILQNNIATLCGIPAMNFSIEETHIVARPIEVPAGLPACLLERRPDVAAAERRLAASCAQIGVAYSAYFPSLSLTGQFGYLSNASQNFLSWSSSTWAIGPAVTMPIFDGGVIAAGVCSAQAAYDQARALYQAVVLKAFEDVQTALTTIHYKDSQQKDLDQAVIHAEKAMILAEIRYRQGLDDYLDVIITENTALQTKQDALVALGDRFVGSVNLIKALGGGFDPTLFTVPSCCE